MGKHVKERCDPCVVGIFSHFSGLVLHNSALIIFFAL